jgi:arabinose-5-phosphate isomerase
MNEHANINENTLELAKTVLRREAQALEFLAQTIDDTFLKAVQLLLHCQGRVVVSGVGKSGHIGCKVAATFASTGTPSFFVHAGEAAHGDLGMITRNDVVLAISNSGTTAELLTIVPTIKREGAKLIAMTSAPDSALARYADIHLDVGVRQEACPLGLAPTTSTTATLALADALAVACLQAKGFSADDFARSHPGGALGRRLLIHVADIMRTGQAVPSVTTTATVLEAVREITAKRIGMTAIVDENNTLKGIFTEGDLRRLIERVGDIRHVCIADVMTPNPKTIAKEALAAEAAHILDKSLCNQLLIVDTDQRLIGALHLHDLMSAKVI